MSELRVIPLPGMPLFAAGMSVAGEIADALGRAREPVRDGDVLVIAQKVVSKAEGAMVDLAEIRPRAAALDLASRTGRDPAMAQLILDQSSEVLRASPAAIVARHRSGHVLANAGIDASNVPGGDAGRVLLWPSDPDASARGIRAELAERTGRRLAVIIADSMGRAWRIGTCGSAIGVAGLNVIDDRRGREADLYGRTLQATMIAVADSIAAAAVLILGEGAEGTPVALVRGAGRWVTHEDGPGAVAGLRPLEQDLFR